MKINISIHHFFLPLLICFAVLSCIFLFPYNGNTQSFQRFYGNTLDDSFSKVIKDGSNYYVLGQSEPSPGGIPRATVTRLDATGQHLWTLSLDISSIWNDAVLIPGGDLLVVGSTLPFDANTKSLMGRVSSSGGGNFSWLRSYEETGRDYFNRVIKNPIPQNQAFPYYVLGSQNEPGGTPTTEDVVLFNLDANGTFNWKKKYTSPGDDEFFRDLDVLPNGDLLLAGNGLHGLIYKIDNTGSAFNGLQIPQISFSDIGLESSGGLYAVGNGLTNPDAHVLKCDQDLIIQWDIIIPQLTSVSQVWEGVPGEIYVTGRGSFGGQFQNLIIKLLDTGPSIAWVKYLNAGSNFFGGSSWLMPNNEIAYIDARVIPGGLGGNCAFMSISDLDLLNACMVSEDMASLIFADPLPDGPLLPPVDFQDVPMGTNLLASGLNWLEGEVCNNDTCGVTITLTPLNNCGIVLATANATGPGPFSYQWCDGETSSEYTAIIPCGEHEFCVSVTCADGSIATATQSITILDNIPPQAICIPPDVVVLDANCMFDITPEMIDGGSSDNCLIQSMSVSPTLLNGCGIFTVTLSVVDWCNNVDTCTTEIQTIEDVPPIINCPPDLNLKCDNDLDPNTTGIATSTDNCDPNPSITYSDIISGELPCDGQVTRIWTATDNCGNVSTCVQVITVIDNVPPLAVCVSSFGVDLDANCMFVITPEMIDGGSTDNCQIQSLTVSPSVLTGCGIFEISLTVLDICGNSSTCTTDIQTTEIVPPIITCPVNLNLACDDDLDPSFTGFPTVIDNCDPNPVVTYSDVIFGQLPCDGLIQRTWTAEDNCGNEVSCTQNIQVLDNEAPTITCPSDMTLSSSSAAPCEMVVNGIQWLSASDNCGTPIITYNISGATNLADSGDASGTSFNQGVSTVTYTATDECGNTANCSFTVTVECEGCPPTCQTNIIDISTGADPNNLGNYLAPGGSDPMWTLIAAPPNSGITSLPQPANLIGTFGNSWDAPISTWLSANQFNNYGVNNCNIGPQDCTCPPFVFQRSFCLCDDGNVTFDFGFWSDNNGSVELWKETVPNSGIYVLHTPFTDNCSNLNSVVNFNSPPTGPTYNVPPVSVNITLGLTKGRYSIRINHWNISGVAMGVNLLGTVTGLNLEKDICCSAGTGTICVTKYHDINCDGIRDLDSNYWTYIDPGLNNWGFNVIGASNSFFGTTNIQGQVCFTGLTPNSPYTVTEVPQAGWTPSNPPGGTISVSPTAFSTTNITFGNCSQSCDCGPHEFLYSIGKGPFLPKFCGDVIYIPEDLPFQFLSSFSCLGACNPITPTIDFVLSGPPGFATISNNGIPANPGYSLPIVASTFTIAGTYTLTLTGHCGNILCSCSLTFIYPGDCCKDQELFCAYLEHNISILEDNAQCKVTVKIDSLPVCDSLEWINWGDNTGIQFGPFGANSMPMHTYSGSGVYIISYLAIEKDPITGLICFEKIVTDTIFLSCDDSYCPLNLVQNGDFMVGTISTNDEDICNALRWCGIWPQGNGVSTADFYNSTTAPPPGTAPLPLSQDNYAGMWCRKQATQLPWREGLMNELQQSILPNSGCYELELKLACTGFYFGSPTLTAYGVDAPSLASGSQPTDGASPLNLALFPAGDAVELWNYPIPGNCDQNFQTISFTFNSNLLPAAGISHIFFTRSDNTNGGVYIAIDDVCLKPAPCPDICCIDYDAFLITAANIQTNGTLGDCMLHFNAMGLDSCMQITYVWGDNSSNDGSHGDNTQVWHTYATPGTYTVCHIIEELNENDSLCWSYEFCEDVLVLCDSCCSDFDAFCQNLENEVSISVDNDSCKATVNIGDLGICNGYLEFISWGTNPQQTTQGPIPSDTMVMFPYPGNGTYEICYLAIELDSAGFICFEKLVCDSIEVLCDPCCSDLSAFIIAANAVQTNGQIENCMIHYNATGLDSCMQISYLWGDNPPILDGPYTNSTAVWHTYSSSGTYNVCYFIEEVNSNDSICWTYEHCEDVMVVCDTCTCGDYFDLSYRPIPGVPNIPIECGDTLTAQCDALTPLTINGNFLCDSNSCPDTTQMSWILMKPLGTSSGSMKADPGFGISLPPTEFDSTGTYNLILKALCGQDTCYCEFTILVECDTINATTNPSSDRNIGLFPNPTSGDLTIVFIDEAPYDSKLQIIDLWGRTLKTMMLPSSQQQHSLSISTFPVGIYFIKITENGIPIWIDKIIKL